MRGGVRSANSEELPLGRMGSRGNGFEWEKSNPIIIAYPSSDESEFLDQFRKEIPKVLNPIMGILKEKAGNAPQNKRQKPNGK